VLRIARTTQRLAFAAPTATSAQIFLTRHSVPFLTGAIGATTNA
jgi:hypothetical protein